MTYHFTKTVDMSFDDAVMSTKKHSNGTIFECSPRST